MVKLSVPGGTLGPLTVQPELHAPERRLVVAVVVSPPGGAPPLTVLSVIRTDKVPGETYEMLRSSLVVEPVCAGTLMTKLTGTGGKDEDALEVGGIIDPPVLPPPHPVRTHSMRRLVRTRRLAGMRLTTRSLLEDGVVKYFVRMAHYCIHVSVACTKL